MEDALTTARYGPKRRGDLFVGFWVGLMVAARNANDARRLVLDFFRGHDVATAVEAAGVDAVGEELRDASRLYFASCLTDPQYGSSLFGMKRMDPTEVRGKIANEAASALGVLADSRALDGPAAVLPEALVGGYVDAMGGDAELLSALPKHPSGAQLYP